MKITKQRLKEIIKEELQLHESTKAELAESDIDQMQSEILKDMIKEEISDIMSEDDDQKEFDKATKDKEQQRKFREFCAKLSPKARKTTWFCTKQFTGTD